MLKVNLSTYEATNEPIPAFLQGLKPESLLDLSWTDPALGVQGFGWWPETYFDNRDPDTETVTGYTYSADPDTKTVTATAVIQPLTAEELAAIKRSKTPQSVTMRQARLQLLALDKLAIVDAAVPTIGPAAQVEWEYASMVERSNPLIPAIQTLLGWTEDDLNTYFIEAAKL